MQYSRMPKISAHTNTELGAALRHRTTELGAAPRHSLDVASQILFCLIELKVRSLRGLFEYTKSYHYEGCRISNVLLGTTTKCVLRGDPLAAGFRAVGPPELEAMRYRRAAARTSALWHAATRGAPAEGSRATGVANGCPGRRMIRGTPPVLHGW